MTRSPAALAADAARRLAAAALPLLRVAPQPVTEHPVPHRLRAVEPVYMQIAPRLVRRQSPVAVPPWLADHQPEPDRLQRRYVVPLAAGVGHRQVDVDHGLGRQPRDRAGAHVLQLQHPPAQGLPDPVSQLVVLPRPGGIGIGDLDADGRNGAWHPQIGAGRRRGVGERHDLGPAGHPRSLLPAYRQIRRQPTVGSARVQRAAAARRVLTACGASRRSAPSSCRGRARGQCARWQAHRGTSSRRCRGRSCPSRIPTQWWCP